MQYYLMLKGVIYGPYTLSEMQLFRLFADTLVHLSLWPNNKWGYASDLPELRDCISDLREIDISTSSIVVPNSSHDNENRPKKSDMFLAWIIPVMAVIAVIVVLGFMQCDREEKENKYTTYSSYQKSDEQTVKSSPENKKHNALNKKDLNRNNDSFSNKNYNRDSKRSGSKKMQYANNSYSLENTCKGNTPYTHKMSCKRELFENKSVGKINLPNGDIIDYQYRIGDDSYLHYSHGSCSYIRFTMADKQSILQNYSISARQFLDDDRVDEHWLWAASGTPRDEIVNPDGSVWGNVKPQDLPVFCQHQFKEVTSDYILVYISKR